MSSLTIGEIKMRLRGWREGAVGKHLMCKNKDLGLTSQNPHKSQVQSSECLRCQHSIRQEGMGKGSSWTNKAWPGDVREMNE